MIKPKTHYSLYEIKKFLRTKITEKELQEFHSWLAGPDGPANGVLVLMSTIATFKEEYDGEKQLDILKCLELLSSEIPELASDTIEYVYVHFYW